jgi:DNA-binding protein HU-beta
MTKAELIESVASKVDLPRAISGFGTFSVSARKARTGRNPKTGESIEISASRAAKFKAGKTLKDSLN